MTNFIQFSIPFSGKSKGRNFQGNNFMLWPTNKENSIWLVISNWWSKWKNSLTNSMTWKGCIKESLIKAATWRRTKMVWIKRKKRNKLVCINVSMLSLARKYLMLVINGTVPGVRKMFKQAKSSVYIELLILWSFCWIGSSLKPRKKIQSLSNFPMIWTSRIMLETSALCRNLSNMLVRKANISRLRMIES